MTIHDTYNYINNTLHVTYILSYKDDPEVLRYVPKTERSLRFSYLQGSGYE